MPDPAVLVKNNSNRDVFIAGDPDWDDQELTVDGTALDGAFTLAPGASVTVSEEWPEHATPDPDPDMLGVIFAEQRDYNHAAWVYQLRIGRDPELGVTDESSSGTPEVKYVVEDRKSWSMTMDFVDA